MKVVRPSDIRTFAFCPRLYFFEKHLMKAEELMGLKELVEYKIKLVLGKAFHFVVELVEEGEKEKDFEGKFAWYKVKGRPDVIKEDSVVEVKSSKGPEDGAWYGDYLQASLYAAVFDKEKVVIKYRNGERELEPDEEEVLEMLQLMELIDQGYLPPPKRSKWCNSCPFKEVCEKLGDEGDDWFPRLPYVKKASP